jgi:hypothetical protein
MFVLTQYDKTVRAKLITKIKSKLKIIISKGKIKYLLVTIFHTSVRRDIFHQTANTYLHNVPTSKQHEMKNLENLKIKVSDKN